MKRAHHMVDLENSQGANCRLKTCTPLRSDGQLLNTGDQKNGEGMAKTCQVVSFTASSSSPEGTALDEAEDVPVLMEDVHTIGLNGDSHESDNQVMSDHNLPLQENHLGSNANGVGPFMMTRETYGQSQKIHMVFESEEQHKNFLEDMKTECVICNNELVRAWMLNQKHIIREYLTGSYVNGGGSSAIEDTGGGQTARNFTQPHHASVVLTNEAYNVLAAALPLIIKLREAFNESLRWWTVSYMMSRTTMEEVMAFCRLLKLVDDMDDENLRSFLEDSLHMEKAGLSDDTITRRLKVHVLPAAPSNLEVPEMRGEHSDTCSICMAEYKNQDKIASLYYCSHEYHADCIKKWLLKSNVCPICRALAIIPQHRPDWNGDIKEHRANFMHK